LLGFSFVVEDKEASRERLWLNTAKQTISHLKF